MRCKLVRMRISDERLKFKRGTPPETEPSHIEAWKCPECYKPTRKAKCLMSQIQYGFEWDDHVDYFRCKCGCTYYAPYRVWLVERDTSLMNGQTSLTTRKQHILQELPLYEKKVSELIEAIWKYRDDTQRQKNDEQLDQLYAQRNSFQDEIVLLTSELKDIARKLSD